MERPSASEMPPLSAAAVDLITLAQQAEYPSELRALPQAMARAAIHGLRPSEVGRVLAAIAARRAELAAPYQPELSDDSEAFPVGEVEPGGSEAWTPTRVLQGLPTEPAEPDWMERQLPNGDRD